MNFLHTYWRHLLAAVLMLALLAALALALASRSGHPAHQTVSPSATASASAVPAKPLGLDDPRMKEIALELVSSAENSTLDWRSRYGYIEHLTDNRGYTAGIMGFCSGTGDMLEVVQKYTALKPGNILAQYLGPLRQLDDIYVAGNERLSSQTGSVAILGSHFVEDWQQAASDPLFRQAQDWERDRVYFDPALKLAKSDGLHALGQFIYFDAAVNMGSVEYSDFQALRAKAIKEAPTPAMGGQEGPYLRAFLKYRLKSLQSGAYGPPDVVTRVTTAQQVFLDHNNLNLAPPLRWHLYGDPYQILALP